ncbi:N-alpha-acetyltransferase 40 isoform X2 [Bacillus rossius redtenbacheri]|uniref:N-alpha-acetyltransferase 40 isoform X2 n=1 Tax=Bacillus rossius redtenbacheri TaxID=93214 RepID=UPI002FDE64E3
MARPKRTKLKRLKKKLNDSGLTAAQKLVAKANQMADPMAAFVDLRKYESDGLVFHLECKKASLLPQATLDWAFELLKRNMQNLYEQCEWGWNEKAKRDEMTDEMAWYLTATASDNQLVAFSHFRFDVDYGDEVLYCYELQLDGAVRRKGLGQFMLRALERMAFSLRMKKVVLTVLKLNPPAVAFFTALRVSCGPDSYTLDDTSPREETDGQRDYLILSKKNRKRGKLKFS